MEELLRKILDELRKFNMQNQKVYTTADLAEMFNTYEDKINRWRKAGLIVGTKKRARLDLLIQ